MRKRRGQKSLVASSTIRAFVAVQDAVTWGSQVLDYLGIGGERRKAAENIIGKGGVQAERLPVLLVAEQMREHGKWRWITFGLGLAGVLLSTCSLLVAAVSLILSVIISLSG